MEWWKVERCVQRCRGGTIQGVWRKGWIGAGQEVIKWQEQVGPAWRVLLGASRALPGLLRETSILRGRREAEVFLLGASLRCGVPHLSQQLPRGGRAHRPRHSPKKNSFPIGDGTGILSVISGMRFYGDPGTRKLGSTPGWLHCFCLCYNLSEPRVFPSAGWDDSSFYLEDCGEV